LLLDEHPKEAKQLTAQVVRCLEVWQDFLARSPKDAELASFPILTMEFGATYPFTKYDSLYDMKVRTLRNYRGSFGFCLQASRLQSMDELKYLPESETGDTKAP